jgi:betaine-aldehyde dehydrogenase
VLVHSRIAADFTAALAAAAKNTKVGAPSDKDAFFGPVNNANQLSRVQGFLERTPDHAEIVAGGKRIGDRGYFLEPTVVAGLKQNDEMIQDEVFGPVITVQKFDDEAQAVRWANDVRFGLSASVWTQNHGVAMRVSRRLDFGAVWINTHLPFVSEMPHGGYGHSGYGKDLSMYGFEEYTRIKHVMSYLG